MDDYGRLAQAFVGLADTLVADYDAIELSQQLVESSMALLPIAAAGLLIGDVSRRTSRSRIEQRRDPTP